MSWSKTLKNRQQVREQIMAEEPIAVMFSDIRGFTTYTAREGDHAAYRLSQTHTSLHKQRVERADGFVVKTLGDGLIAAFPTPSQGLEAAVEIQRAIREENASNPDRPIDVGIGLASGTPVVTDSDIIGHSVNVAQRVSSLAKGGQILVTEAIYRSTLRPGNFHYLPLGEHHLKGLGNKQVYEVAWMKELARLSDGDNKVTLVITEKGTLVVELAKEIQAKISAHRTEIQSSNDGPFSRMLSRGISRFTQMIINKSLEAAGVGREHSLNKVRLSLEGDDVVIWIGKKKLKLANVNKKQARDFLSQLQNQPRHKG